MPRWFRRTYRKWAKHQLERRGYLEFIAHRPAHAYAPDFSDLWFLYKIVRRRKPTWILEFGSGCSTVILAQALWDNERESVEKSSRHVISVDADSYWADATSDYLPDHLRAICRVFYSPLLEVECFGTLAFRHAKVPSVTPDFIYLDGPDLTPERRVAVDVLDIEDRFQPSFYLVVDGRKENTTFLLEHLKRRYVYRYRRQFRNSIFELIS